MVHLVFLDHYSAMTTDLDHLCAESTTRCSWIGSIDALSMNIDQALTPVLSATAGQSFTQMLINSSEGKGDWYDTLQKWRRQRKWEHKGKLHLFRSFTQYIVLDVFVSSKSQAVSLATLATNPGVICQSCLSASTFTWTSVINFFYLILNKAIL